MPVSPHHPALSAWLLSELCLPYPGDSAFTSCNQGHAQNHSVLALYSLTPGLCLLWSLLFPRRASPMFVYDWSRSPCQPHPANIPQPPAECPAPLPTKAMSAIPRLSRNLQHLLVTQSFPRHQSRHQAQQTISRTDWSCGPCSSSVTSRKARPHPCLTGVTAGAKPTLFLPGLRLGRALPSSDTGFSVGVALAGSSSAPGPFMAAR